MNDANDEEVPSSLSLQPPSVTLEFDGEDEGDESYTAKDAEVASSTEANSSEDEDDVPLVIIQQNKEKRRTGTSKKKQITTSKAVSIV
jgi:hypothetical protein